MAPTIRKAPYKDFLQPALHRRFSSTATVLLVLAYILAILLGELNSFLWSWFPIGPVGFRTSFLFASGLTVIILRISQYHFGSRATVSPIQAAQNLFSIQALEAWIFYGISSTLFGLVFLWSRPTESKMDWVIVMSGDRVRLNERPVFFSYYLMTTAMVQVVAHMVYDEDQLRIDVSKLRNNSANNGGGDSSVALKVVVSRLPAIVVDAAARTATAWLFSFLSYALVFRRSVWAWALTFFRPFYNLPKTNMLPQSEYWMGRVIGQCLMAGFCLTTLWMVANLAFSTFMVKEPLKNGRPLTSESKDPNGSLLNGLKSKKMSIKCFALWELAYISRDFEARRKAIFEDIDRKDGPMWSQVYVICLDIIKSMETRIDTYGKPPPAPAAEPEVLIEAKGRSTAPLKDDPIFRSRPASKSMRSEVEKALTTATQAPGQSPISQLSPIARKTLLNARDRVLTKEQQEALSTPQITGQFQKWASTVVQNEYVGWLFRQDFQRQITPAVLGTPYAEVSHHVNAVDVLCLLAVHSLAEDKFGNVHRDVANIIRTLTRVTKKLEVFKESFPLHWTDLQSSREAPEVDAVLTALKRGLAEIVEAFEPYTRDLRLTRTDMREAKETAAISEPSQDLRGAARPAERSRPANPEMEQVGR